MKESDSLKLWINGNRRASGTHDEAALGVLKSCMTGIALLFLIHCMGKLNSLPCELQQKFTVRWLKWRMEEFQKGQKQKRQSQQAAATVGSAQRLPFQDKARSPMPSSSHQIAWSPNLARRQQPPHAVKSSCQCFNSANQQFPAQTNAGKICLPHPL